MLFSSKVRVIDRIRFSVWLVIWWLCTRIYTTLIVPYPYMMLHVVDRMSSDGVYSAKLLKQKSCYTF